MQKLKKAVKGIETMAFTGLILISLMGCSILPVEEEVIEPKIIQKDSEVEYYTVEAKRGNISESFNVLGDFATLENKEYAFTYRGGVLKSIYVKPGDSVKPGMVLAELENDSLDIRVRQQELALRKAEIAYAQAKAVPKADPYDIKLVGIDLESARLQLDSLKLELDKSRLVCKNTGVVDFVEDYKAGDFVEIHKPVVRVVNDRKVILVYKGTDAKMFKKYMKVNVSFDGKSYKGRIIQEGKSLVKFQVDELDMRQDLIGQYANIEIIVQQKKNVIVLPSNLIHEYSGQKFVKVLEDGVQTERFIKLGLTNDSIVEVVDGLKEGEKVTG